MIGLTFGLLGPVLAVLRPRNVLGWLLLGLGLVNAFGFWCEAYGVHTLVEHPGSLPGGLPAAWIGTSIWPLGFGPAFVTLPLLFPSGRLRSGRWRVVLHVGSIASAAMVLGLALSSESLQDDVPGVQPPLQSPVGAPLAVVGSVLLAVCVLATTCPHPGPAVPGAATGAAAARLAGPRDLAVVRVALSRTRGGVSRPADADAARRGARGPALPVAGHQRGPASRAGLRGADHARGGRLHGRGRAPDGVGAPGTFPVCGRGRRGGTPAAPLARVPSARRQPVRLR